VSFTAKDVTDLENFYKDVLELDQTYYGGYDSSDQIKDQGYSGHVAFLTDSSVEMHLATRDLTVAFKTGQGVNPFDRGHIAFRTDDIEGVKRRLVERGVPYADYGRWALKGWNQIFFQDPEGNVVEVHQVDDEARNADFPTISPSPADGQ
jgi:catechol 2,3-dioxygenase-like lactoylglutathione lyase family enzyme